MLLLPPPDSSMLIDIDANGTADVNFQYDALGRRVARTGTGGSVVYVQMEKQTIADYLNEYRCECDEWEPIDSDVCGSNQSARQR
ncbi:MAG: hypothetical protein LW720_10170 [Pirellula sp.]|nr:hypothetical protein [Pirellula sp.]